MLSEKQKEKLEILNRRKRHLEDSKKCLLDRLSPILQDLEEIRIAIDEIELESKYDESKKRVEVKAIPTSSFKK